MAGLGSSLRLAARGHASTVLTLEAREELIHPYRLAPAELLLGFAHSLDKRWRIREDPILQSVGIDRYDRGDRTASTRNDRGPLSARNIADDLARIPGKLSHVHRRHPRPPVMRSSDMLLELPAVPGGGDADLG